MLQPQKEFQSQHILYCAPENPTIMQKSPGNYPVLFLLLIEKLIWSSCLFICVLFFFILQGSRRARHFKLMLYCYRKWWERSQKSPSLGNKRLLKPRPGRVLPSGVLGMCWNKAWERGAACRAAPRDALGGFGRVTRAGSTVLPRFLSPAPCSDAVPAAVLFPGGVLC